MSKLKFLSVCGADDTTDVLKLDMLLRKSPIDLVAGILIAENDRTLSRYPTAKWFEDLRGRTGTLPPRSLSFHLCGSSWLKKMLFNPAGKDLDKKVALLCEVFSPFIRSIQLNLAGLEHMYKKEYTPIEFTVEIMKFLNLLRQHTYLGPSFMLILQCTSINEHISDCVCNCSSVYPLVDGSGGKGIGINTEVVDRVMSNDYECVGLAGGINVHSAHSVLDRASQLGSDNKEFWLCAETGCMGADDRFSIGKVRDMCANLDKFHNSHTECSKSPIYDLEEGSGFCKALDDYLKDLVSDRFESKDEPFCDFWLRSGELITNEFVEIENYDVSYVIPRFLCKYARRCYMELLSK